MIFFDFFSKRRFLLFTILFLLVAFFLVIAKSVKFSEDVLDFLPQTKDAESITDVFRMIQSNNKVVVVFSSLDTAKIKPGQLISCAESFSTDVKGKLCPELVREVTYKINEEQLSGTYDLIWNNLPLFLDDDDYRRIDKMIDSSFIDSAMNRNYKMLVSPAGMFMKKFIIRDPIGISKFALEKFNLSGIGNSYCIINNCIFSKDGLNLLMFITAANPASESYKNAEMIKVLDKIVENYNKKYGGNLIDIKYCGASVASVCNSTQIKIDFLVTMGIAVVLLLVFLACFFKDNTSILVMLFTVAFGGLFSLAMICLIKPDISLIAIGAGSLLLGIALNYSIHFYAHYLHVDTVREVINDLATPLIIGSTTTIGAFLGLLLVQSEVLRDFGLFSALCLVGSVLFSLIFLPFLMRKKKLKSEENKRQNIIDRISSYRFEQNRYVILGILVMTVLLFVMARHVSFDADMNKLGYLSPKLRKAEMTLKAISDSSLSEVYLVSKGRTLDESLKNNERLNTKVTALKRMHIVNHASGVSSVLLSDSLQRKKIIAWKLFWTRERKEELRRFLAFSSRKYKFTENSYTGLLLAIDKKYNSISSADFDYLKTRYAGQFISNDNNSNIVLTVLKINPANLDKVIKAFPENEHTSVLQSGSLLSHFIETINSDFNTVLLISSLLVFFFLLFSYGRIELAIIAFIPMLISWVWILGLMSLFNVKFNIFSIILSAFIFGLGDDYSIFIMDGLLQEYKKGIRLLNSYKTAVFLSAFTTFVGIGVLIFAKHPALRSMATLTIIGMISVVFISYTLVPALFKLLVQRKNTPRKFPVTLFGFIYATLCYSYFVAGCVFTVVFGLTFLNILPVRKKKRRLILHYIMMLVCRSTMYVMFFTKKKVYNLSSETFKKPCVIIANHQSSIDIPLLLMFYPKVIMITNNKLYYSKIGGVLIRMSGYLPSSLGYDEIKDKLTDYISDGYSIIIFPEGSRSPDQQIHRFHKGAFYLAEKMKLDILPVVIHGTGNYVAKGELLGKKSLISVKFLERISFENYSHGINYSDHAKNITRLYRQEFDRLLDNYKNPLLYNDIIVKNFIYKGPILEWYTRIKLRFEKNYELYNNLIPFDAVIFDLGCGYGYLSLILSLISNKRKIVALDHDSEKIQVANHCISKPDNLTFISENIIDFKFQKADIFVLSDVLHYLTPEQQINIIKKCFYNLNAGGKILIADANKDFKKRHNITKLTEFFSTTFGYNKKCQNKLSFFSAKMIEEIAKDLNFEINIIERNKTTSNLLFILQKNP